MLKYAILYLVAINLITYFTYGTDKKRAIKKQWRISEKTLLLLAVAGGSPAAILGMRVFRHKTKRPLFIIGVPCILLLQVGIVSWLFRLFAS